MAMTTKFKQTKFPAKDLEIRDFRTWCTDNGIDINSKVYIGHEGSCHGIGVIATGDIHEGDVVAIIKRSALLTASGSVAGATMRNDEEFMSQITRGINPWIPLLIALITEYAQSGHSKWQPYLNLVPNNETCPPPMLWDEEERAQLLRGTGVDGLVERDLQRILSDYATIVEPFFKRNRELIPDEYCSRTIYEKAVSFVMSYSFTDSKEVDPLSDTVMVPFVDLLNHHHDHNAELSYHPTHLRLVAIRDIKKGEEIMNTFGQLPNYSLLHTYGFAIPGNSCDAACLALKLIEGVCADTGNTARKWAVLKRKGLLEESYEVSNSGHPDEELLKLIRLLSCKKFIYRLKLYRKWSVRLDTLKPEEKEMLKRIILAGIKSLPRPLTQEMQLINSSKCRQQVSQIVRESSHKCLQTCLTFFS